MHVVKNVCENLIHTIFGEKDKKEVKRDMEDQNIDPHLWLFRNPQNPMRWMLPHVNFVLIKWDLSTFQARFKSLKVPSDYSSSTTIHLSTGRLSGMKAHDWHVFMQQFLPLCLQRLMQENTYRAIMCLNGSFDKYAQRL
jgi:hypothetical protein